MTYIEFHTSLMGYEVRTKNSNTLVNRWELFIRNYTLPKIKEKFNLIERDR